MLACSSRRNSTSSIGGALERLGERAGEQEGARHRHAVDAFVERHRQLEHAPPVARRGLRVTVGAQQRLRAERVGDDERAGRHERAGGQVDADDEPVVAVAADRVDHQQLRQVGAAGLQRPEVEERVLHLPEPRRRHATQRHRRRQRRANDHLALVRLAGRGADVDLGVAVEAVPVERTAAVLARRSASTRRRGRRSCGWRARRRTPSARAATPGRRRRAG